jgi:hypothetical protein
LIRSGCGHEVTEERLGEDSFPLTVPVTRQSGFALPEVPSYVAFETVNEFMIPSFGCADNVG